LVPQVHVFHVIQTQICVIQGNRRVSGNLESREKYLKKIKKEKANVEEILITDSRVNGK
jgi:hypothetical protein